MKVYFCSIDIQILHTHSILRLLKAPRGEDLQAWLRNKGYPAFTGDDGNPDILGGAVYFAERTYPMAEEGDRLSFANLLNFFATGRCVHRLNTSAYAREYLAANIVFALLGGHNAKPGIMADVPSALLDGKVADPFRTSACFVVIEQFYFHSLAEALRTAFRTARSSGQARELIWALALTQEDAGPAQAILRKFSRHNSVEQILPALVGLASKNLDPKVVPAQTCDISGHTWFDEHGVCGSDPHSLANSVFSKE